MFRKLVVAVTSRLSPAVGPPVAPDIGQRIQEREQAEARERLLIQARRRGPEHLNDGPTR